MVLIINFLLGLFGTYIGWILFDTFYHLFYKNFRHLKLTYSDLDNKNFYSFFNVSIVDDDYYNDGGEIVYFHLIDEILVNHLYLSVNIFSPFRTYWFLKYKKWFKKNIVISELPGWFGMEPKTKKSIDNYFTEEDLF